MKIAAKLSLFFLLLSISPIILVGYLSYQSAGNIIEKETIDHLRSTNIHKAAELNLWIRDSARLIELAAGSYFFKTEFASIMAAYDPMDPMHVATQKKIADRFLRPFVRLGGFCELLILRAKDGKVLISTDERQEGKILNNQPFFTEGRQATFIQTVYYSMTLQRPAMTISTPVKDGQGNAIAVLAGRLDLSDLSKIMEVANTLRRSEDTYLVNSSSFFITEPRFGQGYALRKSLHTEGVRAVLEHRAGTGFYDDYRGIPVIGAYRWLSEWDMGLITEIDQAEAVEPVYALLKTIAALALGGALLAAIAGLGVARTITRPVHRLVRSAAEIGQGNLNHHVRSSGKDEMGHLSRAFDQMKEKLKETLVSRDDLAKEITARKLTEASLRESQDRLRRAEAMGHLGNWRMTVDGGNMSWSEEMYRILGVPENENGPTFQSLPGLVHESCREEFGENFSRIHQDGNVDFECRIVRPDGRERHVAIYGEVEMNSSGTPLALIGTVLDITDSKEREEKLEEKNAELERFTYTISHDLKSPLVTIKTFAGYLDQDISQSDNARIEKDLQYIRDAAEKMGRLLDELLEMSRIGRLVNAPVSVSFRELVDEALGSVAGRITETGTAIEVEDVSLTLFGDRQRLVEIWQNLVENAVKYMGDQPSPRIRIGVIREGRETVFYVRDNGMGIDPRYQEKVFGWFEKLNPAIEGTGLGLALVKRIVEIYRGSIRLESQGLGHGACFRFTLPETIKDQQEGDQK